MSPLVTRKLNFRATYNNQNVLIDCDPQDVAKEIAACFRINMENVTLWAVDKNKRVKISPQDITDLMKIEIVPTNGQKNIQASMAVEKDKKLVDNMISKLRQNTSLTGQERRMLIEALETHSTTIFSKRKLNQTDFLRPTSHKKIQVEIKNNKDSFTQTDILYSTENQSVVKDNVRMTLKRLWSASNNENSEEIESLMAETFKERRKDIHISCPPVALVKEQYPALFCVEQVKNELDRIFYPGKCLDFLNNMQKYCKPILHYGNDANNEILERINIAISRAHTPVQKAYAEVVGSVFILSKILEEDFGFIHLHDYPQSSKDIYPHIDASLYSLKRTFVDGILFHIMVEGQHLCEASNFPEALLCLMASFFIFNINYPNSCRRTLTVIEKVYLEANDTAELDDQTEQMIKLLVVKGRQSK